MSAQLAHSSHFTEKKLIPYSVGKESVMIYPTLTPEMPLSERAHAFNINKNALGNLYLPQKSFLRCLGESLGCGPVVSLTASAFTKVARSQLRDKIDVSATTYHGTNGHIIKDAVNINNKNSLKSISDDLKDDNKVRPDGICYARLQSLLNFP